MLSRFTRTIIRRRKWKLRELHSTVNWIACREILYRIAFYLSISSLSFSWKVDSCTIANWDGNTHSCRQSLWFIGVPRTSPLATYDDGPLGDGYNANPLRRFPVTGKRDDSRFPHVRPLLTMQIRIDYNRYRWYAGKQIYPIPRMRARAARLHIYTRINCRRGFPEYCVLYIYLANIRTGMW